MRIVNNPSYKWVGIHRRVAIYHSRKVGSMSDFEEHADQGCCPDLESVGVSSNSYFCADR